LYAIHPENAEITLPPEDQSLFLGMDIGMGIGIT
jgi:hypothetical protein